MSISNNNKNNNNAITTIVIMSCMLMQDYEDRRTGIFGLVMDGVDVDPDVMVRADYWLQCFRTCFGGNLVEKSS